MTGKKNDTTFRNENYISGVSRFGLENPIPSIFKILQLYGN
jgi:hypothetical protein